ncbi:MAG: mandelate racemase [Bacteroides sp. SM23_62_1]|nr:MAG: mandelate racemase [Bacteroides sp. SM23_62_1]
MKFTKIDGWSEEFSLSEPYTIAYETVSSFENIFLRAETDKGIVAVGCAAPDKVLTGETVNIVLEKINSVIEAHLKNCDPFRYISVLESLRNSLTGCPSTMAMVDMMLYDLQAKVANIPLYKLLGGYRESIPTSITIGIMPLEDTIDKAVDLVKQGFHIIKVKGGISVSEDIERILRLREKLGKHIGLRFDANQGYTVPDAIKFMTGTKHAGIELFEQPTPRNNFEWLGMITKKTEVPVIADESLMNLKDAFRITRNDLTDMINIKLMKVGGITEAMHINSAAKAAGIEAMVGCLDECELGIAAGLHFALSRPNIVYADLDGHIGIVGDPTTGVVLIKDGVMYPNQKPGLGFSF